jgi:hypothetical protein
MPMDRAMKVTLVILCSVGLPLRGWAQVAFPKASDGYDIKKTSDVFHLAPSGFEGHSTVVTQTATGITPATAGKSYVMTITISSQVPDCPQPDGTENGDGEMSVVVDFTDSHASGPSTAHASMHSTAKYKGKVDDDARLINPIKAEVDYAYSQSGVAASTYVPQHITLPVTVSGADIPGIGNVSGGDYALGHFSNALDAGWALAFFGGVAYSAAETKWLMPDTCVHVVFDPPSFSRQPVPGSTVKVNAYINTKGGEGVRGKFPVVELGAGNGSIEARANRDESVSVTASNTDPGSPAIFYYTAPSKKLPHMGFKVGATSRAGSATGVWETGLGTNWSGQITATKLSPGVDRASDLITAHHSEATRITINVRDGFGTADGYSEIHDAGENRHYVADGNGKSHIEVSAYGTQEASVQGQVNATANVVFDTTTSRYSITVTLFKDFPTGKSHTTSCARGNCTSRDEPYGMPPVLVPMGGKYSDLLHVSGSMDLGKGPQFPGASPVAGSYLITWDLSRTGTTK